MTKTFKIILALVIVGLLVAGWLVYNNNRADRKNSNRSYFGADSGGAQTGFSKDANKYPLPKGSGEDSPTVYTHPTYGFNLDLPAGFKASNFAEGEGEVVMISNGKNYQMQIFVRPFKDSEDITAAKIRRDIPDLPMKNPTDVSVGGNPATAFYTANGNGLKMREIWFTRAGNLYQISAKSESDNITGWIMERWSWE